MISYVKRTEVRSRLGDLVIVYRAARPLPPCPNCGTDELFVHPMLGWVKCYVCKATWRDGCPASQPPLFDAVEATA